jgi:hypothetical protein
MKFATLFTFGVLFSSIYAMDFDAAMKPIHDIISQIDVTEFSRHIDNSRNLFNKRQDDFPITPDTEVCQDAVNDAIANVDISCLDPIFPPSDDRNMSPRRDGDMFGISTSINPEVTVAQLQTLCSSNCQQPVKDAIKSILDACVNDSAFTMLKYSLGYTYVMSDIACTSHNGSFCIKKVDLATIGDISSIAPGTVPSNDVLNATCNPCAQKLMGKQFKFMGYFMFVSSLGARIDFEAIFEMSLDMIKLQCLKKPDGSYCATQIAEFLTLEEMPDPGTTEFNNYVCGGDRCIARFFQQFTKTVCDNESIFTEGPTCSEMQQSTAMFQAPICKVNADGENCLARTNLVSDNVDLSALDDCSDDDCRCAVMEDAFEFLGECCTSVASAVAGSDCASTWGEITDSFPCATLLNNACSANFPTDGTLVDCPARKTSNVTIVFDNIKPELLTNEQANDDAECGTKLGGEILECKICKDVNQKLGLNAGDCEAACSNVDGTVDCEIDVNVDTDSENSKMEKIMQNSVRTDDFAFTSVEDFVSSEFLKNDLESAASVSEDILVNGSVVVDDEGAALANSQISFAVVIASIIASIFFAN